MILGKSSDVFRGKRWCFIFARATQSQTYPAQKANSCWTTLLKDLIKQDKDIVSLIIPCTAFLAAPGLWDAHVLHVTDLPTKGPLVSGIWTQIWKEAFVWQISQWTSDIPIVMGEWISEILSWCWLHTLFHYQCENSLMLRHYRNLDLICFLNRNIVLIWYNPMHVLHMFHKWGRSWGRHLSFSRNRSTESRVWNICIPQCVSVYLRTALWRRKHSGIPSRWKPLDQHEDFAGRTSH